MESDGSGAPLHRRLAGSRTSSPWPTDFAASGRQWRLHQTAAQPVARNQLFQTACAHSRVIASIDPRASSPSQRISTWA